MGVYVDCREWNVEMQILCFVKQQTKSMIEKIMLDKIGVLVVKSEQNKNR